MSLFWSLAALMMLLALVIVLPPLVRRRELRQIDRNVLNTEVARERLVELELDLESGRIEPGQYQAAREDLERELLADLAGAGNNNQQRERSGRWAIVLIVIAVPLVSTLLYRSIGSERIITLLQGQQTAAQQTQQAGKPQLSVEEMASKLATRMQQDPDNLKGWIMLARSYTVLQRYTEAIPAYQNILRLGGGNNAGILADYADALTATHDGRFTEEAGKYLDQALSLDPNNIKTLWLAGHWKNQSGDITAALEHWEQAARLMQADSEDRHIIQMQIAQVRQQAGLPPAEEPVAMQTASTTTKQPVTAAGTTLQVSVRLDPALQAAASPDDTVFIYARAASGPPMPLAIVRKQVRDLPLTVTLDDSMSMAPGMVLSGFPELTVGARVSKSGNAMAQSGDLQGLQTPVRPAATPALDIVIDSRVP